MCCSDFNELVVDETAGKSILTAPERATKYGDAKNHRTGKKHCKRRDSLFMVASERLLTV